MTRDQLMASPKIADGVNRGRFELLEGDCVFCAGIGSRHRGESAAVLDSMFLAGKYATPEYVRAERRLPRTVCSHCAGSGRECFLAAVEEET